MDRKEICEKVGALITTDRNTTHGEPISQLAHAASIKAAVGHRASSYLTGTEVEAIDMICTKLSRLVEGRPIMDHWEDIIGYAAIAAEARARSILLAADKAELKIA